MLMIWSLWSDPPGPMLLLSLPLKSNGVLRKPASFDAVEIIHFGGLRWVFFRNSSNMARISAKLCQNAFQTIPKFCVSMPKKKSSKISDQKCCCSLTWRGFWRATAEWTSKSTSLSKFALDRLVQRSARPTKSWIRWNSRISEKFASRCPLSLRN